MKIANTNEPKVSYPSGSRLLIYGLLLEVLYKQELISKGTFDKSQQHVKNVVERCIKGQ